VCQMNRILRKELGLGSGSDMKDTELLRLLFEAHRQGNESLFQQAAQSLIGRELAGNRHAEAQRLLRALGESETINGAKLARLPTRNDRAPLLIVNDDPESDRPPVLAKDTQEKIDRFIRERREASLLKAHGLNAKSKILFWGPPGCGKTYTAGYIASSLSMPLATVNLGAVFSSLLGGTAGNLVSIFDASKNRPIVLFIDEFDTIAKERNDHSDIGEPKRVVNSLLQLLDAFQTGQSILIAASNHDKLLDNALWRRFDETAEFSLPTEPQRRMYLTRELRDFKVRGSIAQIAKVSGGKSYSDLARAINESLKTMILNREDTISTITIANEISRQRIVQGKINRSTSAKSKQKQ